MQHPVLNRSVVQVPLMMNRSRLDSLVLDAAKVLGSQLTRPHVLGAAEVLNSPVVLGSTKMLSPAHVNTMATAESATVTTHMATAAPHVSTTRMSAAPTSMTVTGFQPWCRRRNHKTERKRDAK